MARLKHGGFHNSDLASPDELDTKLSSEPLLNYAYHAWAVHGRESMDDPAANARLFDFVQECRAFPIFPRGRMSLDRFGPLHVIAAFDLPLSLATADQLRDVNPPSQLERLTPLHLACVRNSRLVVEELLALRRINVNGADKDGSTPLMRVLRTSEPGDDRVVDLLLSHPDIKVNQANKAGRTPLHEAAGQERAGSVKRLLAHPKIKVNQADARGRTPFMVACACTSADGDLINLFLAHPKLKVDAVDEEGRTALMWLMMMAGNTVDIDVVKTLLEYPKIKTVHWDKRGHPTAYYARQTRRQDIMDLLISHRTSQRR
jgi:ankyrin repeat protein